MTTNDVPDSIKALWAIHDEPRFGAMSADDIKRRAKLLHDSDRRMRYVGPGIATLFIVFFAAAFASHETLLERAGDIIGVVGGLIMSLRIHGLNLDHPSPTRLAWKGCARIARRSNGCASPPTSRGRRS